MQDMTMNATQTALAQSYRELAAKCREMAAGRARSGPILRRAEVFDAKADAIEREGDQNVRQQDALHDSVGR
jgi:hypothetical protein